MVAWQAVLATVAFLGAGETVLLDFYSDSCRPCRAMEPAIRELARLGYPVRKVNVEQDRALAAKYRVRGIPCFVMLVEGQEVDRVVGRSSFSRLARMCRLAAARPSPDRSPPLRPVAAASKTVPRQPPRAASPVSIPSGGSGPPLETQTRQATLVGGSPPAPVAPASPDQGLLSPGWTPRYRADAKLDARLIAASVRLRIEDPQGHSCGSGTIIDARKGEALILTCGHIFRDSRGKGRIEVDLFGPSASAEIPGRLISFDLSRDVGLVCIRTAGPVTTAPVAPPGYQISKGTEVVSVGCNNGDRPSARHSRVSSLHKYQGPPNLQVAGLPVEGRSGGGLFSKEGLVIGVCNAADPTDQEGLYAALGSIHGVLDEAKLAFVYDRSTDTHPAAQPAEAPSPAALVDLKPPPMPPQMPRPSGGSSGVSLSEVSLPSGRTTPRPRSADLARLGAEEQAALEEILRRLQAGAEVICVVRSRRDPMAKSEIIVLDKVSPLFLDRLAAEARAQETSLEIPRAAATEFPPEAATEIPSGAAPAVSRPTSTGSNGRNGWRPRTVEAITGR